ncbi:MAG: intermembrane transport protein PqiB [Burkholderiales bacterium]
MPEPEHEGTLSALPAAQAQPKSRWSFQVVWLIPLVSALIGGWLAVKAVLERGPTITVSFQNAEGLEAGKTKLKYKDVEIGLVKSVTLAQDLTGVIATAELVKDFTPHLVEDTRFWIVRPRISGGTVSGLNTLLSGSYVAVDIGKAAVSSRNFQGLDTPPIVAVDAPGREFALTGDSVGSVDSGSPVFFRRLKVGQVTSYALNEDGNGVTIKVFVNAPYDKYVGANTRFWNASGFDVTLDANGLKLELESFVSILLGGIAFETPTQNGTFARAAANTAFQLFANRTEAMKNPESDVLGFVFAFNESARGLVPGAPVDFRGLVVGEVVAVKLDVDPKSGQIVVPVEVNIYPDRMRLAQRNVSARRNPEARRRFIGELVARGMRAQLRTGSFITGSLYVALDFFPRAGKAQVNWASVPVELPTTPGGRQELQQAIASVAAKIESFPLAELGNDARSALASADRMLKRVDTDVTPELRQALQSGTKLLTRLDTEVAGEARAVLIDARKALVSADKLLSTEAPLQQDAREAMREMARAAQAFRTLADYLERDPQAVLLGKKAESP